MGALIWPCELNKVSARLLKTEKKFANYINAICEFEDIEYTNDLFLRTGGENLDFGFIEYVDVYKKSGIEYWEITTSMSYFKFQILNRPQWVEVKDSDVILNALKEKKSLKDIEQGIDSLLNEKYDFSSISFPWNR